LYRNIASYTSIIVSSIVDIAGPGYNIGDMRARILLNSIEVVLIRDISGFEAFKEADRR
jgi:hypothetical protein